MKFRSVLVAATALAAIILPGAAVPGVANAAGYGYTSCYLDPFGNWFCHYYTPKNMM